MDFWRIHSELHKYHSVSRIGSVSKIAQEYRELNSSVDKEEFWQYYLLHGKSDENIKNIAHLMALEANLTDEECYNALKDLICGTINGFIAEDKVKEVIEKRGNKVVHASPELDANGVDLIVNNRYYVQVKPVTFFYGNSNQGLLQDRQKMLNQAKKLDKPLYVMVYKKEGLVVDPKPYRPEQLIANYGIVKFN